jgi:hypothetical protein
MEEVSPGPEWIHRDAGTKKEPREAALKVKTGRRQTSGQESHLTFTLIEGKA